MVVNDVANALLLDHAAGSLAEPLSLAVSTHIAINGEARAKYDALNEVGGVMIEEMEPAEISSDALSFIMSQLDAGDQASAPVAVPAGDTAQASAPKSNIYDSRTRALVPEPLRGYLPTSLDDLPWKSRGRGVKEFSIETGSKGFSVSLLAIDPGRTIPAHTHRGREYTVVLDGSYEDGGMMVQAGDLVCNDDTDVHKPIADQRDGCLCLAVTDAPLRFKGPLGWIINPFLRH